MWFCKKLNLLKNHQHRKILDEWFEFFFAEKEKNKNYEIIPSYPGNNFEKDKIIE